MLRDGGRATGSSPECVLSLQRKRKKLQKSCAVLHCTECPSDRACMHRHLLLKQSMAGAMRSFSARLESCPTPGLPGRCSGTCKEPGSGRTQPKAQVCTWELISSNGSAKARRSTSRRCTARRKAHFLFSISCESTSAQCPRTKGQSLLMQLTNNLKKEGSPSGLSSTLGRYSLFP